MNSKVFQTLQRIAAETDAVKQKEMKLATDAELAAHFSHPANATDLHELAWDIFNQAWADTMSEDIVPQIIEVRTVGLADVDYIEEDLRGMRAYWQGPGGQIRSDILRAERERMPRDEMVSAIDIHEDELTTRFWGTIDSLSAQANAKLRQLPVERLIELIQASVNAADNSTYYGEFAVSTLSDANVDSVLDEVAARSNGEVSIMGTRVATRYLSNVGLQFGDNVKEQVFRTGQIGVYKGYPVVQVENFEDFAGSYVLPNDELFFVGRKAGRLTFYGQDAKTQQLVLPSFWKRWETAKAAGMLLYGAGKGRIGRLKLV